MNGSENIKDVPGVLIMKLHHSRHTLFPVCRKAPVFHGTHPSISNYLFHLDVVVTAQRNGESEFQHAPLSVEWHPCTFIRYR